jgi:hypothetical protein
VLQLTPENLLMLAPVKERPESDPLYEGAIVDDEAASEEPDEGRSVVVPIEEVEGGVVDHDAGFVVAKGPPVSDHPGGDHRPRSAAPIGMIEVATLEVPQRDDRNPQREGGVCLAPFRRHLCLDLVDLSQDVDEIAWLVGFRRSSDRPPGLPRETVEIPNVAHVRLMGRPAISAPEV